MASHHHQSEPTHDKNRISKPKAQMRRKKKKKKKKRKKKEGIDEGKQILDLKPKALLRERTDEMREKKINKNKSTD